MYRTYGHMGMYWGIWIYERYTGGVPMYRGVQMCGEVYRCIGHTDIWKDVWGCTNIQGAYRCIGAYRYMGDAQKYGEHTQYGDMQMYRVYRCGV